MASPDEFAALAPAIKLKDGAHGYLITLAEPNAWWKVNSATEAVALLRMAWSELNGESTAMPNLVPHAILDAPGALFVEQTNDEAAAKGDPVSVAHQIMEVSSHYSLGQLSPTPWTAASHSPSILVPRMCLRTRSRATSVSIWSVSCRWRTRAATPQRR